MHWYHYTPHKALQESMKRKTSSRVKHLSPQRYAELKARENALPAQPMITQPHTIKVLPSARFETWRDRRKHEPITADQLRYCAALKINAPKTKYAAQCAINKALHG